MIKTKKFALAFLCLALFALMLSGCFGGEEGEVGSGDETGSDDSAVDKGGIVVSTGFGDLYYQEQWEEFIRTNQRREGDSLIVAFDAEINGKTYQLFEIVICGNEGALAGQITAYDGTKRNVYARIFEIVESPELTEGEQNRLYAMQEDINYVIDNLK